jgi:hypothetical protein
VRTPTYYYVALPVDRVHELSLGASLPNIGELETTAFEATSKGGPNDVLLRIAVLMWHPGPLHGLFFEALIDGPTGYVWQSLATIRWQWTPAGWRIVPVTAGLMAPAQAFDPTTVPGLAAWYDASRLGLYDGDRMSMWPDLSGNGNHLTQGVQAARPVFKTAIKNGLPVVRFDGAAAFMQAAYSSSLDFSNHSIFAVVQDTSVPSGVHYGIVEFGNPVAGTRYTLGLRNGSNKCYDLIFNGVSQQSAIANTALPINTFWNLEIIYDGSNVNFFKNGTADGTPAATPSVSVGQQLLLVGGSSNGSFSFLPGDIAEVLLYNRALAPGERQSIEAYVRTKWGTP